MKNKNVKNYSKSLGGAILSILIGLVIGIPLIVFGNKLDVGWMLIVGLVVIILGVAGALAVFTVFRDKARKKCSECGKSMKGAEYTWQLDHYKESGRDGEVYITYYYDVHAFCPHCGKEKHFTHSFACKDNSNPDVGIRNYLNNLYRK